MHTILCVIWQRHVTYTYMCVINVISNTYIHRTANVNECTGTFECAAAAVDLRHADPRSLQFGRFSFVFSTRR